MVVRALRWLFGAESSAAEAERGRGEDESSPWKTVATVYDQASAVLMTAFLKDAGIPVRIRQEAVSSALPVTVGLLGRIELRVPESMQHKALLILAEEHEAGESDADTER